MSSHRRGQLYVALAALAWSSAGLFQRQLHVTTATQIAGRGLFAFIALSVMVWVRERSATPAALRSMGRFELAVSATMASSMALFIFALNHSTVANVLFMQALAPFVAVVLAWFFLRERATRRTWLATLVAISGVTLMAGTPGSGPVIGIVASLLMSICFGTTIVLLRVRREVSMAPALALAQLLVVLAFGPFAAIRSVSGRDLFFLILLGFGQQGLGQLFFSIGGRLIPATEVAIITLLEVVAGPLLVWLVLSERPGRWTIIGGLIVLVAVVVQATERGDKTPSPTLVSA